MIDSFLKHLSPSGWGHINLTGILNPNGEKLEPFKGEGRTGF